MQVSMSGCIYRGYTEVTAKVAEVYRYGNVHGDN